MNLSFSSFRGKGTTYFKSRFLKVRRDSKQNLPDDEVLQWLSLKEYTSVPQALTEAPELNALRGAN